MADQGVVKVRVHCPRVARLRTIPEHLGCLYCYGHADDVESAERALFCDWDSEKDPVVFGFPTDTTRNRAG